MAVDLDVRGEQDSPVPPVRDRRRPVILAGALVAAWLVPLLTDALAADWLLPLLMWAAVASLLRSGRTVLDRLMIALGLLAGAVPVAGLVISYWPWGLQPVPVAGFGFTGLVVIAALARRRPEFPIALRPADLVVLGLSAASFAALFWPFRHGDRVQRFALVAPGGDYAAHFSLFDSIRKVGGYVFLRSAGTELELPHGMIVYPQGLHFTGALLASFIRSDGHQAPTALTEFGTFLWFEPATYLFMCVAILWAMRWIAGPSLRMWLALPVGTLGLCYILFGDMIDMNWGGFWAEMAALGEFALLIAVLARPLPRVREQVVLVVALCVAIDFTYYLMLPVMAVALVAWLWYYRQRLRGHGRLVLVATVVGTVLAGIMVAVNTFGPAGLDYKINLGGAIIPPDKRNLWTFTLVAFGLAAAAARRSTVWRVYLAALVSAVGLVVAIGGYQEWRLHTVHYYFFKAEHVLEVVAVLGLGAGAPLLSAAIGRVRRSDLRLNRYGLAALARAAVPSTALAVAAVAALGPFLSDSLGRQYEQGRQALRWPATVALRLAQTLPADDGTTTVVYGGPGRGQPPHATEWSNALLRTNGAGYPAQWYLLTDPPQWEQLFENQAPHKVRVVTDNPRVIIRIKALLARRPDLAQRVQILVVPLPAR